MDASDSMKAFDCQQDKQQSTNLDNMDQKISQFNI